MTDSRTFLAFDLGATSGRAILGRYRDGTLSIEEIHRFPNDPVRYQGGLHWDAARLFFEICRGLRIASTACERLDSVGVDTWGVDYGLLGEDGGLLENPYHYRDARVSGKLAEVCSRLGERALYRDTGIAFHEFNTLIQLYAARERTPRLLKLARTLVTMPDLFHYWLCGVAVCEYTIASTTQMLSRETRGWAFGLLDMLGIPIRFLPRIVPPGTLLGPLLPELAGSPALAQTVVVAPACHDTASAVAAVETEDSTAFLSSGTWSLLGAEMPEPVVSEDARRLNFTNEGGAASNVRLLKNITGLWLLEGCRDVWKANEAEIDHDVLRAAALTAPPLQHIVDPESADFLRPNDMTEAIRSYCLHTGQTPPETQGAFVRCVLESLAFKYWTVLEELQQVTGRSFDRLRVIGGGSLNNMLNQFTADATGRAVLAGPAEATALGNIAMQMVGTRAVKSLADARRIIAQSFPPRVFEPQPTDRSLWSRLRNTA